MCTPQLSLDMEGPNVQGKAQSPVTEGIPECNVLPSRQVGGGKESACQELDGSWLLDLSKTVML